MNNKKSPLHITCKGDWQIQREKLISKRFVIFLFLLFGGVKEVKGVKDNSLFVCYEEFSGTKHTSLTPLTTLTP